MKVILDETLEKKGISQYKLAQLTGIAISTLSNLKNNKTDKIKFDTLDKICATLNCDISDILQVDQQSDYKKDDTE